MIGNAASDPEYPELKGKRLDQRNLMQVGGEAMSYNAISSHMTEAGCYTVSSVPSTLAVIDNLHVNIRELDF